MLSAITQRRDSEDEGFTLIELMVVVLIIAILLAIAIPTFLGARNSANQRAAQSDLRNALTAEQSYYSTNQAFTADTAQLTSTEQGLSWTTGSPGTATPNQIGVAVDSTSNVVILSAQGKDGNCYLVEQSNAPTGSYTGYEIQKATTCTTPAAASGDFAAPSTGSASSGTGWYSSW